MGREGDLGRYQEVQAGRNNGNAVVMKACVCMWSYMFADVYIGACVAG